MANKAEDRNIWGLVSPIMHSFFIVLTIAISSDINCSLSETFVKLNISFFKNE